MEAHKAFDHQSIGWSNLWEWKKKHMHEFEKKKSHSFGSQRSQNIQEAFHTYFTHENLSQLNAYKTNWEFVAKCILKLIQIRVKWGYELHPIHFIAQQNVLLNVSLEANASSIMILI